MKMSDVFELPLHVEATCGVHANVCGASGADYMLEHCETAPAVVLAINCHDDLVAALTACEASLTEFIRDHPDLIFACDERAVSAARAALAKARGEA